MEVGLGNMEPEEIPNIIKEKDRAKAGKTLPPQGLYLVRVEYEVWKEYRYELKW